MMTRTIRRLGTLAVALALSACATRAEVAEVVSDTNAAMLSPELIQPGGTANGDWKDAVRKIDRIIAAHPDQAKMNAALRVRQAMLLTVNKADALAAEVWTLVDAKLLGARDQSLYRLRESLIWWYGRASEAAPFAPDEDADKAVPTIAALDAEGKTLGGLPDLRLFLATLRVNLELKRANSMPENSNPEKAALALHLTRSLKIYAEEFGAEDLSWAKANYAKPALGDHNLLSVLRHRVALISVIKEYKAYAKPRTPVTWDPDWINSAGGSP